MTTYRLDLSYDGTGFHGYAKQPDMRTVQGELEAALARIVGPLETVVAGRTDAGVHAKHQVVSFSLDDPIEPAVIVRRLNGLLDDAIVVLGCSGVSDTFSARFSAASRTYQYMILNREAPDPLVRFTSWHVPYLLDVDAMQGAVAALIGEHDFASFCRKAEGRSTVRKVLDASWRRNGVMVELQITATSFCHQMVRSIVALCVEVGRGRVPASGVPAILEVRDRAAAKGAAPPHGLTLWNVSYD
jgi:tRNA pseudouridine38-40 synthase